jgi:formylmethanofuran dehydrogenase subunit E-like metal-binding protein
MNFFQCGKARVNIRLHIISIGLFFLTLFPFNVAFADACQDAIRSLRASFEVTQGRGGIWGFMEQNSSLRGKSMIGFQVDGKLQRIIVIFETQCVKSKQPSKKNYQKIESILGDARMIFNLRPGRDPVKKIMGEINGLNSNLNKLIKELEA